MKRKLIISKAQQDVWAWKEQAGKSLLALPPEEWLSIIQNRTADSLQIIQNRRKKLTRRVRRIRA